jgi:hypothetical protein
VSDPGYGSIVQPDQPAFIGEGIFSRVVDGGQPKGYVGAFAMARPATDKQLAVVRKYVLEIRERDLDFDQDGEVFIDRAAGTIYRRVDFDPLLSPDKPGDGADCFVVTNGMILFLARVGSVDEREQARLEHEQRVADAREQHRKFVSKQPLRAVTLNDVERRALPTIARAAALIESAGGQIKIADDDASLVVTIPERVDAEPILDRDLHQQLFDATHVVTHARSIVLAELRKNLKTPLAERLPDQPALA